ncbi:calcium-activated potassium channel subunit beta-3 [Denticeps clupeoides]|uniref:calcium-activated potassium channel subunit beta-3 n=1 Tax=Denticeps clupeoides TaxID=299321 RepID=UPI0010A59D23|nr:calcium-activated potassium channel subunit beta-3-like [Denticeps clupeoides]
MNDSTEELIKAPAPYFLTSLSLSRNGKIPAGNTHHQGIRRRQTREAFHPTSPLKRDRDTRAKTQVLVSSAGEDRAILLGITMIAFSILMFFVVGITLVKPHLQSDWGERTNCSISSIQFLNGSVDCRGRSSFRCLQVHVSVASIGRSVRLHDNEEALKLSPECFYIPKCQQDKLQLLQEGENIRQALEKSLGVSLLCRFDDERYPDDALLYRQLSRWTAAWYLLWPGLMLGGGALLLLLVKLSQHLAHLCSELESGSKAPPAVLVPGNFYQLPS